MSVQLRSDTVISRVIAIPPWCSRFGKKLLGQRLAVHQRLESSPKHNPDVPKNIQIRHLNCNEVAEGLEAKLHERITTAVVTELQGSRTTSKVEGAV